jgi:hypothetical protein
VQLGTALWGDNKGWPGGDQEKQVCSFLKKKNQKTFAKLGPLHPVMAQPEQSNVFCFFFSKKKCFLY